MSDMLVKLNDVYDSQFEQQLLQKGILIKRALSPDKDIILEFIRTNFSNAWANESEYALFNNPISCYIAVKDKKIIGFSCYDATTKNFFGPIGIKESERKHGIGKVLLLKCLNSMKESGYAYAIIGWVDDAIDFYKKEVNAVVIEDSEPNNSIYKNLISI